MLMKCLRPSLCFGCLNNFFVLYFKQLYYLQKVQLFVSSSARQLLWGWEAFYVDVIASTLLMLMSQKL